MKRATPLLFALAAALPAAAQEYDLGQIVVSANREGTSAEKVGATVEVLTEADLKKTAQTSVVEAISALPGVVIRPNGPPGSQTGFLLRGASQYYVGVRVDGIDVTDPSGPQVYYDFGQLGTAGISRIEVLKGSQSALYGSSAVGGLVDIRSLTATLPGLHQTVEVMAGSYGTANLSYGLTWKDDTTDFALTLSHNGSKGFPAWVGASASSEDDGFRANRMAVNGSHRFGAVTLGFSAFAEVDHGDYFPYFYGTPSATATRVAHIGGARVYGTFETGAISHTLSLSTYRIDRTYAETAYGSTSSYGYTGTRQTLSYQGAVSLSATSRLVFGTDWSREVYDQYGDYGALNAQRHIGGVYGELSLSPTSALDVTLSVRNDRISGFGHATTARLAAAWRPSEGTVIRASAGTGFRAPSPYELYSIYGTAGLEPEKSRSADIGIEHQFGNGAHIRATAFWLSVDNLIDYNFASTACLSYTLYSYPGCYTQVSGTSRRSGIEIEGALPLSAKLTLAGSYTYTDSATNATSSWASVPRHALTLSLEAALSARLKAVVTAQGGFDRPGLPDYGVLNTVFSYQIDESTEAYLRIDNLFDADYQLVKDYATSGRAFYAGLRKTF